MKTIKGYRLWRRGLAGHYQILGNIDVTIPCKNYTKFELPRRKLSPKQRTIIIDWLYLIPR